MRIAAVIALVVSAMVACTPRRHHVPSREPPPWFGDVDHPKVRISGKVFGAPVPLGVRIWLDVPDPTVWRGFKATMAADGTFDFGELRAGPYRLMAWGPGWVTDVVTINTIEERGDRTELFAHESDDAEVLERDWQRDLSEEHHRVKPDDPGAITGTVFFADHTPAAFVGVAPFEDTHATHSWPMEMGIVATTDRSGRFSFVPSRDLWGFRILLGPRTHEVELRRDRYLGDESFRAPVTIQLPAPGHEQTGLITPPHRVRGDASGAGLRGRVVRGTEPVANAFLTAWVHEDGYGQDVSDGARTRSDGTFDIYISSPDLDKFHHVVVEAFARPELHGRILVPLSGGERRDDTRLDVGGGLRVRGVVVDEHGAPVEGVTVGPDNWQPWSAPTDAQGRFEVTLGLQGRYPLHVFSGRSELEPPPGPLPPSVDVDIPDGTKDDVRITVQRDRFSDGARYFSDWARNGYVDVGADIDQHGVVHAVGKELEAAGLRVHDVVVETDPPTENYGGWQLEHANLVFQGQTTTFKVRRDGKELDIRVTAPRFGANP